MAMEIVRNVFMNAPTLMAVTSLKSVLLATHILAGAISLALFWVPVFTRKGGKHHRDIGGYYVICMWVVVITALWLCGISFHQGDNTFAVFLGFLALITAKPLWLGVAILKNKKRLQSGFRWRLLAFNWVIVFAGLALIAYGLSLHGKGIAIFMFVFGALGLSNAFELISMLKERFLVRKWFQHHLISMCVSGIAAHTAFLAFGANTFLSGLFSSGWALLAWLAPTVLGSVGIRLALSSYAKNSRENLLVGNKIARSLPVDIDGKKA